MKDTVAESVTGVSAEPRVGVAVRVLSQLSPVTFTELSLAVHDALAPLRLAGSVKACVTESAESPSAKPSVMASALAWSTARAAFSSQGTWKVRLGVNVAVSSPRVSANVIELTVWSEDMFQLETLLVSHEKYVMAPLSASAVEMPTVALLLVSWNETLVTRTVRPVVSTPSSASLARSTSFTLASVPYVSVGRQLSFWSRATAPASVVLSATGWSKALETEVAPLVAMTLRFFPAAACGTSMLADVQPSSGCQSSADASAALATYHCRVTPSLPVTSTLLPESCDA